jgi:hypothetical protein
MDDSTRADDGTPAAMGPVQRGLPKNPSGRSSENSGLAKFAFWAFSEVRVASVLCRKAPPNALAFTMPTLCLMLRSCLNQEKRKGSFTDGSKS